MDDYDMDLAGRLVQGVDVWLNTPRPPFEASGTSGQKAAMNGVLNLSVLDGWWPEAFDGTNGWAIGPPVRSQDEQSQDMADAGNLYRVLEDEVVPLFYARDEADLPVGWVRKMKRSIRTTTPAFSARRTLKEYVERLYAPGWAAPEVVTQESPSLAGRPRSAQASTGVTAAPDS